LFKVYIFLALIAASIGGAGYLYISKLQKDIKSLTIENVELTTDIALKQEAIDFLQIREARKTEQLKKVFTELTDISKQNSLLSKKLTNNRLSNIAIEKPSITENIINNATSNANRCFELLSGAILTEREKNAKTATQFNSECPWLFSPQ